MIDTLARHMAALSEARRLVGLVLANNGTFGLWQRALVTGELALARQYETELSGDKAYQAYRQLGEALADAQPKATTAGRVEGAEPIGLAERVSLLRLVDPKGVGACGVFADATACCREDVAIAGPVAEVDALALNTEASLCARLNRVLEITAMAQTQAVRPVWATQHDEARVAIVYKDIPQDGGTGGEPPRPGLVTLFR